jgi:hypothetical protein
VRFSFEIDPPAAQPEPPAERPSGVDKPVPASNIYANGLDGATGGYLHAASSPDDICRAALAESADANHQRELKFKASQGQPDFGPEGGLEDQKLEAVGWGVVFAPGIDPQVVATLRPLLDLRAAQAGALYKEFSDAKGNGYKAGDSYLDFLGRSKAGPGPAEPKKVPYYLLLVGDPEALPFEFQYALDVQYAVGRLHFDTPAEYAAYARAVVASEGGTGARPRRLHFFAIENSDDEATHLSTANLAGPLRAWAAGEFAAWEPTLDAAESATKARLRRVVGGPETPALLFAAGHGVAFRLGHELQAAAQGALACRDWPGPSAWGQRPLDPGHYFAAADLPDDADVRGLVAFFFACYGAGTPRRDDYPHPDLEARPRIAPRAFLAGLPRRLLAHPNGAALAVIGHVERTWPCAFQWADAGAQLAVYRGLLRLLLRGDRVGWAMEQFNARYAELAGELTRIVNSMKYDGYQADKEKLAYLWAARNDARSLIVLGDPAVRLWAAPAGGGAA